MEALDWNLFWLEELLWHDQCGQQLCWLICASSTILGTCTRETAGSNLPTLAVFGSLGIGLHRGIVMGITATWRPFGGLGGRRRR